MFDYLFIWTCKIVVYVPCLRNAVKVAVRIEFINVCNKIDIYYLKIYEEEDTSKSRGGRRDYWRNLYK